MKKNDQNCYPVVVIIMVDNLVTLVMSFSREHSKRKNNRYERESTKLRAFALSIFPTNYVPKFIHLSQIKHFFS